jgi:hypothetical protein
MYEPVGIERDHILHVGHLVNGDIIAIDCACRLMRRAVLEGKVTPRILAIARSTQALLLSGYWPEA